MATTTNSIINLITNDFRVENLDATIASFDTVEKRLTSLARLMTAQELGVGSWKELNQTIRESAEVTDMVKRKREELAATAGAKIGEGAISLEGLEALSSVTKQLQQDENLIGELAKQNFGTYSASAGQAAESTQRITSSTSLLFDMLQQEEQAARQAAQAIQEPVAQLSSVANLAKQIMEQTGASQEQTIAALRSYGYSAKEAAAALEELRVQQVKNNEANQQGVASIETYDAALESIGTRKGTVIRQATELTGAQVRNIDAWAQEGMAMDAMKKQADSVGITLVQLKQTLADLGYEVEKNSVAGDKWTQGVGGQIREARAMRYGGLELMAVMSMMSIAVGDQLPSAFKELEKSTMLITSGGLMTAMLGVGAGVGIVVGTVVALGVALFSVDEETQNLNKSLDSMAKKDDLVNTLSKILNVSKETAQAFQDAASKSPAVAAALRDVVDNTRQLSGAETVVGILGVTFGELAKKIGEATAGAREFLTTWHIPIIKETLDEGINAYEKYRQAAAAAASERAVAAERELYIADAAKEMDKQNETTLKAQIDQTKELAKANDTLYDSYVRASDSFNEASDRAWSTLNDALAKASQTRTDELNKFNEQQRMQAEKNADVWRKINDTLRDAEEKAQQTFSDRLYDIDVKRRDKLADLAYDQSRKQIDEEHQRQRRAEELADKLYQIERDRIQALANLDFDTALQLSKAKTENEKDEVMYRALHEREQINQRAENQIEDAMKKRAMDEAEAARRKKDTEDEFAHRKMVVEREYQEELNTARRTYEEQKKAAADAFNDQVLAQQFAEKQQHETAINQLAEIERRNKEMVATAQKRYADEMKAAEDRYAKEKALADQRWEEEKKRIAENYQEKLDALKREWDDFVKVHEAKMKVLMQERDVLYQNAGLGAVIPSLGAGGGGSSGFGQNGLEMIVPPGFNNDSFRINASSGERVSITPAASTAKQSVNISVEPMFAPMFQSLVQQMVTSKVFRDGIELVLNDSVYQG